MLHVLNMLAVLVVFWLLLSGQLSPLLLTFGLLSCVLVLLLCTRMDLIDREAHPFSLRPIKLVRYWLWLLWEIIKSNISVARRILSRDLSIQPSVITVPTSQRTELGQVIYANSITLTPGTVSIDLQTDTIRVHALASEPAAELMEGTMDRKVSTVELVPSTTSESDRTT